jgi:DNA primase
MNKGQPIWEKIKEKAKIPDLVNLTENNYGECLVHGNETGTSTKYYEDSELLHCHKCDKTFDVIGVYKTINNIDRKTAIKDLAKEYNIKFEEHDNEYIETSKQIDDLFIDFMEKCHNNLNFQNRYFFLTMKRRGFTKQTVKDFKIGLFDNSIKEYLEETYSEELLQKAGFINKKGNWSYSKRIVFPYLDRNNKPKYFIYRLIDSDPDFNKNARAWD